MDRFYVELNDLFVTTYRLIERVEEVALRDLSDAKLTISEMHLIECIGGAGTEGRILADIAQELEISPPSATVAVKRLEKKGYVTKDRCAQDARRIHVRLTKEGQRAEIAHRYFHRKMARAVAAKMDETERAVLFGSIQKLNDFLRLQANGMIGIIQGKGSENK